MAAIQSKRFNWVRVPTAWEQTQHWRQRHKATAERLDSMAAANSGFSSAAMNQISESGSLAVKAAIKRNQDVAKAKMMAAEKAESAARLNALL